MPEFHDLLTDVTVAAAGGEATATHTVANPSSGRDWTYYVVADGNGTDMDLAWAVSPPNDATFYPLEGETRSSIDLSGGLAVEIPTGYAGEVRLTVTNNGAADSVVSASGGAAYQ